MSDLESIWERLDLGGSTSAGRVRLRVPGSFPLDVFAARSLETGYESVILELPTHALPPDLRDPGARGFVLQTEPITAGPSGRTRILLERKSDRFKGVFRTLALEVVAHLEDQGSATEAVQITSARLHRWQAFLGRHGPDGLSDSACCGLFGELWCLRQLLAEGIDPVEAVAAWCGPEGGNQDFQIRGGGIEVKTTSAVIPHLMHVSNVLQLDDRALAWLFLLLVVVEDGLGGAWTLPSLVDSLAEGLDAPTRARFDDKLLEVGFFGCHRGLYDARRYRVRRTRYFRIGEGFPRLLEDDLPAGVVELEYAVELGAMLPWERDREELVQSLLEGGESP